MLEPVARRLRQRSTFGGHGAWKSVLETESGETVEGSANAGDPTRGSTRHLTAHIGSGGDGADGTDGVGQPF